MGKDSDLATAGVVVAAEEVPSVPVRNFVCAARGADGEVCGARFETKAALIVHMVKTQGTDVLSNGSQLRHRLR